MVQKVDNVMLNLFVCFCIIDCDFRRVVNLFLTDELIQWDSFIAENEEGLRRGSSELPAVYVFDPNSENGNTRWEHLRQRVIEHNIRVMAKCYSRVSLSRLSQLLNLTTLEAEEYIGKLVCFQFCMLFLGSVYLKVDI